MSVINTSLINQDVFLAQLHKKLNAEMLAAAEPLIKKAIEDIEAEMRRQLAQMLISVVEQSFAIERFGTDIRIIVKRPDNSKITE